MKIHSKQTQILKLLSKKLLTKQSICNKLKTHTKKNLMIQLCNVKVLRRNASVIILQFSVLEVYYFGKVSHKNEKINSLPGYNIIVQFNKKYYTVFV